MDHYGIEASDSEMIDFESQFIEYAARGHYHIYVTVPSEDWTEDLKCLERTC